MLYFVGRPEPNFWTVVPHSENQKDAQSSCDQFPGSIASGWLFKGPFTKDLVFYFLIQQTIFWGPPPGDGGDDGGDGGRISPPPPAPIPSCAGIPYPVRITPHSVVFCMYDGCFCVLVFHVYQQHERLTASQAKDSTR